MNKKDNTKFVYRKEGLKLTKPDEIVVEQREDIRELKEQLYITERAFEMACETLRWCQDQNDIEEAYQEYIDYHDKIIGFKEDTKTIDYFKAKAKEKISE